MHNAIYAKHSQRVHGQGTYHSLKHTQIVTMVMFQQHRLVEHTVECGFKYKTVEILRITILYLFTISRLLFLPNFLTGCLSKAVIIRHIFSVVWYN